MYSILITKVENDDPGCRVSAVIPEGQAALFRDLVRKPVDPSPMPSLRFIIDGVCSRLDFQFVRNVTGAWLISDRFRDALSRADVPCRLYPVEVDVEFPHRLRAESYFLFIPERVEDAVDLERSEFFVSRRGGANRTLTKLVLPPAVEQREPLLFIARPTSELLIHDRLRAPLEAALLADVAFAPLDTVAHPAIGIQIAAIRVQLDASPDDVELWSELARRCGMAYQYRGGLDAIDHALALAPDAADFWRKRGVFLANLRRDDEALAAYERAWNLCERERAETGRSVEPQDWAWQGAAEVLRWQARFAEALAWSERGVRLFPQAVIAWYELGAAYLGLGDLDNALAAFERAPDHGGAATHDEQLLEAKGEVLNKLGRHEEALRLYDRALEFTPINFPMRRGQIEALRALGRHHKAGKAEVELQRLETRVRPKFW